MRPREAARIAPGPPLASTPAVPAPIVTKPPQSFYKAVTTAMNFSCTVYAQSGQGGSAGLINDLGDTAMESTRTDVELRTPPALAIKLRSTN